VAERRVSIQHLRIARATNRLADVVAFYRDVFDFEVIGSFEDHEGFDGVMLGRPDDDFHFEFTHERGAASDLPESAENLIVFYVEDAQWDRLIARVNEGNLVAVPSYNPYWDRHGMTIEDPDGRRIVLHRRPWRARV
jgi:catechol 2,3-dioxygenase-like lactoylglutathione lyase family enzyme